MEKGIGMVDASAWLVRGPSGLANYEFSHEVRRGAQGASRVVPGKSGLYVCDLGQRSHSQRLDPTVVGVFLTL